MNDNFGITIKNEVITKGLKEIQEARQGLYEADLKFYNAIMGLATTLGYRETMLADLTIDITKPEQIIEACRTDMDNLIINLYSNIDIVNKLNNETENKDELLKTIKNNIKDKTSSVDSTLKNTPKTQEN